MPDYACELVFCLPKKRRLGEPLKEVFLEGLYWRPTDSFSPGTDHVMSVYLNSTGAEAEAFEVVTALSTRPNHPWSPSRLTSYLAKKTMADRDLGWSEYLRTADQHSVVYRMIDWAERNDGSLTDDNAMRYVALLSLLLTSTKRDLRDRATRSLFLIGGRHPSILFDSALAVLDFPDPYVPERVLAACYGVAMGYWADPGGEQARGAIPQFAFSLYMRMFAPDAKHFTAHVLMQDYALGVIELALQLAPQTLSREHLICIERPLKHVLSPFPEDDAVSDHSIEGEGRANTARGAAHFLRETVGRVRYGGARGQLTVRADSGFYAHTVVAACREMDVRFSITIRQRASLRDLIEAIPEDDWTPIPR